jgi:hypothetical protein
MSNQRERLTTWIGSDQFPEMVDEFERLVGSQYWVKRVRKISDEIRGNRLLGPYLKEENRVTIAFLQMSEYRAKHQRFPVPLVQSQAHYEACTLVVLFLDVVKRASGKMKDSLVRRVRGAFENPDDLRALQFEWAMAVHLTKQGFRVAFPELSETGTFDLLATKDGVEAEVECKSITHDKGRQVHRREAIEIFSLFKKEFETFTRNLKGGLLVRVVAAKRFPRPHRERKKVLEKVRSAVLAGATRVCDGEFEIEVRDFDIAGFPFRGEEVRQTDLMDFLSTNFGIHNKQVFLAHSPPKRAFVLTLESRRSERLMDYTLDAIKNALAGQLSGTRGGVICVKLEAVTAEELSELGSELGEPTFLRKEVSRFIDSRRHTHLVCLSFLADGGLRQQPDNSVTQQGRSYFFDNPDSPHYSSTIVSSFKTLDESTK